MLFSSLPQGRVKAAAGDLDPAFGSGGKVVTDLGGSADGAAAVTIQPDGKILAGGSFDGVDFALVRYNPDGSLDASFGSGGIALVDFGSSSETITSIAIQPDGKIVAAGFSNAAGGGPDDFALARFNSNGTLDTTFSGDGKVTTDFFGSFDQITEVAIQADGKIVAAGTALSPPSLIASFATARYNSDGSLDTSFGVGGTVVDGFGGINSRVSGMALQSGGKIIVAGNTGSQFVIVKYNPDGSLDASFGAGGKAFTGLDIQAGAFAVQSDGKMAAAGLAFNLTTFDFAVARFNADGSLDTSFGGVGVVFTDFLGSFDQAADIAFQPDGKIIAGGIALNDDSSPTFDFALARYNIDGSLDSTFGSDGKITTDFFTRRDQLSAIAIQPDGKIVAAGLTQTTSEIFSLDFALARYNGESVVNTEFDICLQDDGNGNLLKFSSLTGDYVFSNCRKGITLTGRGTVKIRICKIELKDSQPDRNLSALSNPCVHNGVASMQVFSQGRAFVIVDGDTRNNVCSCR
jgi:uncharacterized delta-60 repeat protein